MTSPYTLTWTAADASYICTDAIPVVNESNTIGYVTLPQTTTNIYTGVTSTYVQFPLGENRKLIIFQNDLDGAPATVTVTGENSFGQSITENISIEEVQTYYTTNAYNIITSIEYSGSDEISGLANTIGTAGGWTSYYITDVFNKNAQYTIAYSDLSGTNSLTPTYMVEKPFAIIDHQQYYNVDTSTWYAVPIGSSQVVVSPTSITTAPITEACAISFKFPVSALFTEIPNTSTGSFIQTILQQGAYA